MPVLGSCDFQLFPHSRIPELCCNLISLLNTSPFGTWQVLWSVWSRQMSHPQAAPMGVTIFHQEEKWISSGNLHCQAAWFQSGPFGRKLRVFVSQDIHLVPEREPLSLLSSPQSEGNHVLVSRVVQPMVVMQDFLLRNIPCRKTKNTQGSKFPSTSILQTHNKQGVLKYKCFIAMFHYLQYRSLCPWVLPKCKAILGRKAKEKHNCASSLLLSCLFLIQNTEKFAALPGHLEQPGNCETLVTKDCQLLVCSRGPTR